MASSSAQPLLRRPGFSWGKFNKATKLAVPVSFPEVKTRPATASVESSKPPLPADRKPAGAKPRALQLHPLASDGKCAAPTVEQKMRTRLRSHVASAGITRKTEAQTWLNRGNEWATKPASGWQVVSNWTESLRCFEKVAALMPDRPEGHYNVGHALFEMGEMRKTIPHLQAALRTKPDHWEATHALMRVYHALEQPIECLDFCERCLLLNPADTEAKALLKPTRQAVVVRKVALMMTNKWMHDAVLGVARQHREFVEVYGVDPTNRPSAKLSWEPPPIPPTSPLSRSVTRSLPMARRLTGGQAPVKHRPPLGHRSEGSLRPSSAFMRMMGISDKEIITAKATGGRISKGGAGFDVRPSSPRLPY